MKEIINNFIVLEGIDGSGTTTQLNALSNHFKNSFKTNEPTSSEIGVLIRNVLSGKVDVLPHTLALLYATDRYEHLYGKDGIIEKAKDHLVISDRYYYSSLAYQGITCGYDNVKKLNDFPEPKLVLYLDTPVDVALSRIQSRGKEIDIFENKAFLEKLSENYKRSFKETKSKVVKINGLLSIQEITEKCIEAISSIL